MSLTTLRTAAGEELPAFVTPDGVPRFLGALPSLKVGAPAFGTMNPVIPRAQWYPVKRRRLAVPILNQGQHGSCTGHGCVTALMLARAAAGMTFQALSPTFIYSQINGGRDAGSVPADAARVLVETGTCLLSEMGEDQIYRPTPEAFRTAPRFRVPDGAIYQCHNWDEIVSAFLLGFAIFDTVNVGRDFNSLDPNGVAPVEAGYGNHCIAVGEEFKQLPDGRYALEKRNSWGERWGLQGRYFAVESHYANQPMMAAYAIRVASDDPEDPTNPPPLI